MCEEAVYDVVALGELLIDFTPVSTDGAGCPTLKANPGGAPGNLLAALSRLLGDCFPETAAAAFILQEGAAYTL